MNSDNSSDESPTERDEPQHQEEGKPELSAEDKRRAKIREQLNHMSFEDIQKLKEKLGSKVFNEVVLDIKTSKPKTDFKRANKNRPREMSSKIRVKTQNPSVPAKKIIIADPRFNPMCGEYDDKAFRDNYKFVNNIKKKEKKELEKELSTTVDPERKKQIRLLIQRITNQLREAEKREKLLQQKMEESREIREKIKKGEKPIYKKKSEKKIEELLHKYDELKNSNKLLKHIERRRKKNIKF